MRKDITIASEVSNQIWEKNLLLCFYTAAAGSHASAWSTHVVACPKVIASLQAMLLHAFWRCCVRMKDGFYVRCVKAMCTSAGSHTGAWTTHAVACPTVVLQLRPRYCMAFSCSCVRMICSSIGVMQLRARGFKNLVLGFVISRSCIDCTLLRGYMV